MSPTDWGVPPPELTDASARDGEGRLAQHMHRVRTAWARARKLSSILRVPAYRRALCRGSAAATEHDNDPFRRAFGTVLDVGSSRGQFALVAARRFPEAALLCFEPLPEPRRRLERVLAGHAELTVIDRALSAEAGEAEFVVSRADDSSSLLPMTDAQARHLPGTEAAGRIRVRTERLDVFARLETTGAPRFA